MELPKNITQIGEWSSNDRVYAEDYVISFMKQLRMAAGDKEIAIALYGKRKEEEEKNYYFIYGACKLDYLQKETRHLSQAQKQEIEKMRVKFFPEDVFIGYGILSGEPVEGFYISNQEICRYVSGYARFYEKNDAMLAYMLEERDNPAPCEVVEEEKYLLFRQKQEELRKENKQDEKQESARANKGSCRAWFAQKYHEKEKGKKNDGRIYWKGVATITGLGALYLMYMGNYGGWQNTLDSLKSRQLPVASLPRNGLLLPEDTMNTDNNQGLEGENNKETTYAENAALMTTDSNEATYDSVEPENNSAGTENNSTGTENNSEGTDSHPEGTDNYLAESENYSGESEGYSALPGEKQVVDAVSGNIVVEKGTRIYIIKKGDTLSAISFKNYGTGTRVSEICNLNSIENPDDIKTGQKIILP